MNVQMINGVPVKIWTQEVEESAMRQIANLTTLPFLYRHLAMMPDVHTGMGMPIGGVLACRGAVIPNAVGVDIGCGMCAMKSSWRVSEIDDEVLRKQIMRGIRQRIPVGMAHHEEKQDPKYLPTGHDMDRLTIVRQRGEAVLRELGTLGGGNHFIELQRDEEDFLWVMIHSGSRNLGARVAAYYNDLAVKLNAQWHSSVAPELKLAFLAEGTREFGAYWREMKYCVDFAHSNRRLMMLRIQEVLAEALPGIEFEPIINIAHNYADKERHYGEEVYVHRKGATLASLGTIGIIPGSMGTASYIVEGLGNPESFHSCSHGAGRVLSRKAAIRTLNLEEEVERLDRLGIVHGLRSRDDLQEAPSAYKDIETVIANQQDLVRVLTRLRPVAVVKG